jgi:hypothetical protein
MASECSNPIGGFVAASEIIPAEFAAFNTLVKQYVAAADGFSQQLADYTINPIQVGDVQFDPIAPFTPYAKPASPGAFVEPAPGFAGAAPSTPSTPSINTSGLDAVHKPSLTEPAAPSIYIPPPPVTNLPPFNSIPPVVGETEIPLYVGGPLPEVPPLIALNLPTEPDINIEDLTIVRPDFIAPTALQDAYYQDVQNYRSLIWTDVDAVVGATGVYGTHDRLVTMLAGGTGLPQNIEQALFDRAIGRDEISSTQAIAQAEGEWSAKGFSLPGATLLARTQEIRQANRAERGRINREISIQFHTQEIENLRFSVEKGIALEGQLLDAHTKIYDTVRQMADGHWNVRKGIYDSAVATFALHLEIYKTDVEVYNSLIQVELSKLEVYKSQLEGQRLIGTLNQQYVDIYKVELDGYLAGVEVYKAEVQGAEAAIRAELSKVEVYKAEIDAYTAFLEGEKIKVESYAVAVGAEETRAKVYEAQVNAYGQRINVYKAEVDAESTKVNAHIAVAEATTQNYTAAVQGWSAGIQGDVAKLNAAAESYKAQMDGYVAELSNEQYRVTGEARGFELSLEQEKAKVAALLKQADQEIEQLKHISTQSLAAIDIATKVNAQLAASAMAAINVSASMSSSNAVSASDSRSCSTQYSASISV